MKSTKKNRKVENHVGYMKNMDTGAVVNTDTAAFKEYQDKKKLIDTVSDLKTQMNALMMALENTK